MSDPSSAAPTSAGPPPTWLSTLLTTPFYGTCPAHANLRRADLNLFDTETCATLCQHCVASNPSCKSGHARASAVSTLSSETRKDAPVHGARPPITSNASAVGPSASAAAPSRMSEHAQRAAPASVAGAPRLLHISRYMYHAVTLVKEASMHFDVAHIQPYLNNGHRVLYLDRSRQPKSRLAPNAASCTVCSRTLQHPYLFCSLRCKLAPNSPSVSPPVGVIASKAFSSGSSSRTSKTSRPTPKSALSRAIHSSPHHGLNDRHMLESRVAGAQSAYRYQSNSGPNASAPPSPATTAPGTPRCCTPSGLSPAVSPPSPPPMVGSRKRDRDRAARRAAVEEKKAEAATAAVVAAVQAETAAAAAAEAAAAAAAITAAAGRVGSRSHGPAGVSKKSRSRRKSRPFHSPASGSKTFVLMRSNLQPLLL